MPANAVVPASRRDETKTRMSSISLMGSVVLVYEEPIYNNIFIVFQGCSECLCKLDFLGGLCLSLNNKVGGYPVEGGGI